MEIIMRKWYAFLSGKKMLGIGLGAVVALTALLAVNFYREQNDRYVTTNGSEALTQAEQANKTQSDGMPSEANQVAEEMNHELPVGSEVGEQSSQGKVRSLPQMMRLDRMQIRTVSRIQNRQHQMKWQRLQVRQALYP